MSDATEAPDSDSAAPTPDPHVSVTISPPPAFELTFDSMTATEELGRPFRYELEMSSTTAKGDLTALLGASVTVALKLPAGDQRYFNGIVARLAYAGLEGGAYTYRIELRPWIWLLSRTQDCRIFQNKSAWDIIQAVFGDAGFTDVTDKRQSQNGSTVLEYCVQYRETSLDFVTRLMEEFGLYYYFDHTNGAHSLVIADDPNSHPSAGDAIPFQTRETEVRATEDHIWQWSSDLAVQPGAFTYRDYNFTTPGADLTAKAMKPGAHTYGAFEIFDYPGPYGTTADGQALASLRMQGMTARRHVVYGTSNSSRLYTGCKFTLSGFHQANEDGEYMIVRSVSSITTAQGFQVEEGASPDNFRCAFEAIKGDTPFRLAQETPRPTIRGPQTAKVVGQSGDEITTDQYGRIKVQFYWDRVGTYDQDSSCWIRVAQLWAGVAWGSIVIPRIGQEVVVEFLEGNPDRPLVTGCVYNAAQTVPYGLPDNKTRTTIKSNSSTGGGGFNELRFEDKAGSEEVFFQAQKDYNKVVLNNETVKVTQDTTTTVEKGNRSVTVSQGNDSHTVSQGNRSATISTGNESVTVSTGNHKLDVTAGSSTITAGQSITLQVGENSIKVDMTGVTINGVKIGLTAQEGLQADGGLSMTLQAAAIAIN
jgi:type VI secretion system secreted protein VgrG